MGGIRKIEGGIRDSEGQRCLKETTRGGVILSYITLEESTYDMMGLLWRGQSRAGQQSTLREVPVGRESNC